VARAVIGVDLGGTNLRTALLDDCGESLEKHKETTEASEGYQKVFEKLLLNINRMRRNADLRGTKVVAVGVGAPGVIHAHRGVVVASPNFPDWNNLPLKQLLEDALEVPVFLENDANAAALGEQWRGAGKGINSMIYLTLGTGVGGGIVHEGRIWQGADGMAGEVGHMTIFPDGRQCGCGNRGCLEMYASSRGIVMSYLEALKEGRGGQDRRDITSAEVYRSARDGEPLATLVMQQMGRYLGIGIASLINIFNPEMVVIGGGVKDAWELFMEGTRTEIKKRAFAYPAERTRIVPSVLGDDAGIVGAGAIALQQVKG
jgi:glucokinase